jgi:type II secretory pathway component PulC
MQNIKYHAVNTVSIIAFALVLAAGINQIIRLSITPLPGNQQRKQRTASRQLPAKTFDDYRQVLDSGFFRLAGQETLNGAAAASSRLTELQLMGTISGPATIARALIKKNTEKDPEVFRPGSAVYGFTLVRIDNARVYLRGGDKKIEVLDMFSGPAPSGDATRGSSPSPGEGRIKQTISRAELQQKVLNNMDNALAGLRAGPYRVDGRIEGFKLFRVQPNSVLYQLGARNGDVVRRVNGHPIESTEKLYQLWKSIQGDSRITIDLERGGKLVNYDFTVSD